MAEAEEGEDAAYEEDEEEVSELGKREHWEVWSRLLETADWIVDPLQAILAIRTSAQWRLC